MTGKIQNCALLLLIFILCIVASPHTSAQEGAAPHEHPITIKEYGGDVTQGLRPKVTLVPYENRAIRQAPDVEEEAPGEFGSLSKRLRDLEQTLLGLTFNFLMQCNSRNVLNDAEERWCNNAAANINSELERANKLRNALHQRAEHAVNSLRLDRTGLNKALPKQPPKDSTERTKPPEATSKPKRRTKPAVM